MFRQIISASIIALFLALSAKAYAVPPSERLDDPVLEEQARELSKQLRCMVCQNQSIDDSDAELAKDLRLLVRKRLVAGDTPNQVLDHITDRYGEYVLLKPRLGFHTVFLWLSPLVFLLVGIGLALKVFGKRQDVSRSIIDEAPQSDVLSDEQVKALEKLRDS